MIKELYRGISDLPRAWLRLGGCGGGAGGAACGRFLLGRIQMRLQRPGTDDDPPSAIDPAVPASPHTMNFPRRFRFSSSSITCFHIAKT